MKASTLLKLLAVAVAAAAVYFGVSHFMRMGAVVAEAHKGRVLNSVSGTITVKPRIETNIASTEPGFLTESVLLDGAAIQKGQVVARIDPGDLPIKKRALQLQIAQLEHELNTPQPEDIQLENKISDFEDARQLYEQGHMPKAEFDRMENALRAAKAAIERGNTAQRNRLDLLRNQLEQLEYQLSRLEIVSPLTGTVTEVFAHPGDLVHQGTPLATIISDEVKIEAEVNQDDVAAVRNAERALVRFFAYGGQLFKARVTQLLPSTDAATQRFTVFLELVEEPPETLPGLTGEVSFVAGERDNTLVIPRRALLGDQVLVVKDGVVESREVNPGFLSMTDAEILEGVEPGEYVIAEDLDLYREGDRVRIERVLD